jgi:hypothetical protein
MKNFPVVDLVEQDKQFLDEAEKALEPTNHKGQFFNIGIGICIAIQNKGIIFFFLNFRLAEIYT